MGVFSEKKFCFVAEGKPCPYTLAVLVGWSGNMLENKHTY